MPIQNPESKIQNPAQPPPLRAPAGNATTPSHLELAVSRLAETYRPEAIWLFGSQARQDVGPDSDYDLLLIVPDHAARQHRKADLAYRALRSLGRAFDITIWRRSAFDEQTRSATSLPSTILREGRLLYAA